MWSISLGLRKFRHTKSSVYRCYQRTRQRSACGLHLRRSSASGLNAQVYYTLVDCNLLTPLLRFAMDLSYKLFPHCCAAVGKVFHWHMTSRGPSEVAELLVFLVIFGQTHTHTDTHKHTDKSHYNESNSSHLMLYAYTIRPNNTSISCR